MIEWFFFDRINTEAAGTAITGQDDAIVLIGPDKTQPVLPRMQLAIPRAQITLNAAIVKFVPITRRDSRFLVA